MVPSLCHLASTLVICTALSVDMMAGCLRRSDSMISTAMVAVRRNGMQTWAVLFATMARSGLHHIYRAPGPAQELLV